MGGKRWDTSSLIRRLKKNKIKVQNNKPDYYNNLDEVYSKIWKLLNSGFKNRNASFIFRSLFAEMVAKLAVE